MHDNINVNVSGPMQPTSTYKTVVLKGNHSFASQVTEPNTKYVIKYDFTLGEDITVPANCVLEFDGGSISGDGTGKDTITGTNTQIKAQDIAIFNSGIVIAGTWNCPVVTSNWFGDLSNSNRILELFKLTNPNIYNEVYIAKGNYYQDLIDSDTYSIRPNSNTKIILDGNIVLNPNTIDTCYDIFLWDVENITIEGSGSIIGDKDTHLAPPPPSEAWEGIVGGGIIIAGSKNINISGVVVKDHWGDCISIVSARRSYNINIEKCTLDNARRQAISICNVDGIKVSLCTISNIAGIWPGFGIDIEPTNQYERCYDVDINNNIFNTRRGIYFVGTLERVISGVSIENNIINATQDGIRIDGGEQIQIISNTINTETNGILLTSSFGHVSIKSNTIKTPDTPIRSTVSDVVIESNKLSGLLYLQNGSDRYIITDNFCEGIACESSYHIITNNVITGKATFKDSIVQNNIINDAVVLLGNCNLIGNRIDASSPDSETTAIVIYAESSSNIFDNTIILEKENDTQFASIFRIDGSAYLKNNKISNNTVQIRIFIVNSGIDDEIILEENSYPINRGIYPTTEDTYSKFRVKNHNFGTTLPSSLPAYFKGCQAYDKTNNKPIWWNGTAWVDATGATV